MQVIDTIFAKIGNNYDGLGSNCSPTERIVHKLYIYDLNWQLNVANNGKKSPSDGLCQCLKDTK